MRFCSRALAVIVVTAIFGPVGARGPDRPPGGAEPPIKLGEERAAAGEDEVIKQLVARQLAVMKQKDPTRRGQHAKHHGCVEAEFAVRADVPPEYRLGLFKEARTFKARARFSNGGSDDDTVPDVHGLAVRVLGVPGPRARDGDAREEQHFVLLDTEVFFAPDARTVLGFLTAVEAAGAGRPAAFGEFLKNNPKTADLIRKAQKTIPSPLAVSYWSTVPFKLGDRAVKYVVTPAPGNGPGAGKPAGANDHRKGMVERLAAGQKAVSFDLSVIPQTDPVKMPVEDATVRWESAAVPVARITIEPQVFDTAERMKECETSVFDAWVALAEHRPLGGVNRARKVVYQAGVQLRTGDRP